MNDVPPFLKFLRGGIEAGGFGTDDVLAAVLPLFDQVARLHERGRVAPLEGVDGLHIEGTHLWFEESRALEPRKNQRRLDEVQKPHSRTGVDIIGSARVTAEVDEGRLESQSLDVASPEEEIKHPVFLPGYVTWEHRCGHHDQLTDIHALGLILASLACALDLTDPGDVRLLADSRDNLFALNERLHPVIAATIAEMITLNRHRRAQTLDAIIHRLRHYREQAADFGVDYTKLQGFRDAAPRERGQIILSHLRNRLFEITRRNRLLYFRPTLQSLNLTLASVPLLLDHRNIKPEQLFIWHPALAKALVDGESIVLGNTLRFEDAPYATGVLDQIISTARRDRAEFGFAQLRLVICFLRWHNLKEAPQERINSPLLLLPVELAKKKGVRDAYVLKATTSEAEVNPALRHHLRQLYGLNLPTIVDLAETTLDAFYDVLVAQIRASEPGVTLHKADRPQIKLIHERARQRLDQFRRRQRVLGRGTRRFDSFDYSYDRERFRPLGLQLFLARVRPARSPFAEVTGEPPAPRRPELQEPSAGDAAASAGTSEREQQLYSVKSAENSGNPYAWDFDTCSQTLGNFNYRKMSLVQDYAALLEREAVDGSFAAVFSLQPRERENVALAPAPLAQQFPVVDCDPTQSLAVTRAGAGESYIIQGPPGTGKSQTITNLIADYVARGKRVLFVCEKRAAIDVVFHRLGRQGLDELCCLIHDSQTDKKEFIRNLKQTYENFLNQPLDESLEARRTELLRHMELELAALRRWTDALQANITGASLTVRDLLARLVELRPHAVDADALTLEQTPDYALWTPHAEVVRSLSAALRRLGGARTLAQHSFRHLTAAVLNHPQPLATITAAVDASDALLATIARALEGLDAAIGPASTMADLAAAVAFAGSILPLAEADALDLLNHRSPAAKDAAKSVRDWRAAEAALEKARNDTTGWRDKLPPADTEAALQTAQCVEPSIFRWLQPAYWRLRKVLLARYDFSHHAVSPSWTQALLKLRAEHMASEGVAVARRTVEKIFGELDADIGVAWAESVTTQLAALPPAARALHTWLVENPEATFVVEKLAGLGDTITHLRESLGLVIEEFAQLTCAQLTTELRQLRADLVWLPDVLPVLSDALKLPDELQRALRRLPFTDQQLEATMGRKTLNGVYQRDRTFEASDGRLLARRVARLQKTYREWLGLNATWIRQRVRREFLRRVQVSNLPASQLDADQKEFKRIYAKGRRELEHEFSKTMRYRSIRDLADDESGVVLRDLKPVWLMSPLSVSDTLPLLPDAFDVVIFDEASQIPVEEAIPAVFRGPQVIVVGDEMQLPPTNFFSSATRPEDELLLDDDEGGSVAGDLDADSFLTQSARNLPSTLLGWHYRSRYEALISYSNNAFYEGRLLTIPDRQVPGAAPGEILVNAPEEGAANVDALLARDVSFHFQQTAVYEKRGNTAEADYIAHLVRELLARETKLSIGIVAFSEAQQGEIESALTRLGADDATFRNRLEEEYEREEDGQFCGLFVKNLENVQGDERDVIILSICYGYDRNKRMLMNFGPINQRGGEKRLNVIFSRARMHMAVVSSIRHFDITNDHNDGANCLRNFLEYAAACSQRDTVTARRVLHAANPLGEPRGLTRAADIVATQLADALRDCGLDVDTQVGQSTFRLPLAVRRPDDTVHALGVLIDDHDHYAQGDLLERYLLRPGVLHAFGWNIVTVYTKDWFHNSMGVLRQIEDALAGNEPDVAVVDDEKPPEEAAPPALPPAPVAVVAQLPILPAKTKSSSPTPPVAVSPARRFEYVEGGSSKFWEIAIAGTDVTVRFGRLGTNGQSQTKSFASVDAAQREGEKLIRSKVAKGYRESTV